MLSKKNHKKQKNPNKQKNKQTNKNKTKQKTTQKTQTNKQAVISDLNRLQQVSTVLGHYQCILFQSLPLPLPMASSVVGLGFESRLSHSFTFHLGFVHPLQDVALRQCLPLSFVCCFPVPSGSLLPCYIVLPSSAWSSS